MERFRSETLPSAAAPRALRRHFAAATDPNTEATRL